MKWPWSKEIDEARAQAASAACGHAHSIQRQIASKKTSNDAVEVSDMLWEQLNRNGWTEMLQKAWGGR